MTQDNQNTNNQPDPHEIPLTSLEGGLISNFPPMHSNDLYQHNFNHLMHRSNLDTSGDLVNPSVTSFINPRLELSKINNKASKIASSIIDLSLQAELIKHIDNNPKITLKEGLDPSNTVTDADGKIISSTHVHWSRKSSVNTDNSTLAFLKIYQLMQKLSVNNHESLNCISSRLTLVVPADIVPFLTGKANGVSVWDMLETACPGLNLLVLPKLTTKQGQCAVLIYNSEAFGPAGYMAIRDSIKFMPNEDTFEGSFDLIVPAHHLVITNPEQIAVLTGI